METSFVELEKLYMEHKDMVYRVCLRFSHGDSEWALDRMQEVFLKLADKWSALPEIDNHKAFIYRTTFNLCINHSKRQKSLLSLFTKYFNADVIDTVAGEPIALPSDAAEKNELLSRLDNALGKLDDKHRESVIMYYLEDIDIPEIASILGVNKGTISRRLKSAREIMAKSLGKEWFDEN
ncbi:sigma-70 family RNA polymerase sigma factor [Myxococcota bacterium]|nr:sigma-70 family RNA polymerase sigma factor [Myxococcota bacterium]MBU1381025.1 sigma-70 family RNA polymerase sigma factor [Myxococcota bacterium]MBU1499076.1 sigma-70 family RNA polymerase sigma factor [Myxococcota bacterium]